MDYKKRILEAIQRYEEKRDTDRKNGEDPPPERKKSKPRSKNSEEWTEAQTQRAVANVLDRLNICWCHVPNEGKRDKIAGNMLRAAGLKAGVPDILIFTRPPKFPGFVGCAIELKRAKGGRVSDNQKKWLDKLSNAGWSTSVTHGFEETLNELKRLGYM